MVEPAAISQLILVLAITITAASTDMPPQVWLKVDLEILYLQLDKLLISV